MRQLKRLFAFLRPYSLQFFASVALMAVVGAMDAFRILLIGPVFDEVLKPTRPTDAPYADSKDADHSAGGGPATICAKVLS